MKLLQNLIFIYCLFIGGFALGQDRPPTVISALKGDTVSWWDEQGQNFLLMQQSEIIFHEEDGTSTQSIRVQHWIKDGEVLTPTWSYSDSISDCLVDVEVKLLAEPRFVDIDNDGYEEVFFMVQKACKGDISPAIVEVIMVDHKRVKYFLEAEQKLVFKDGTIDGGDYDLGDFEELPKSFQDFAVQYLKDYYVYNY